MMQFCFHQGQIKPSTEATIPLAAHSLQYGTTVFGGMRGYNNNGQITLFRAKDHHQRLMNAAKILGMDYYISLEDFQKTIEELIQKNQPKTDFYIRPFIYTADEVLTPRFDELNYDLGIYIIPLGDYLDTSKGLRLMISSYQKFPDACISTKAKAGGAYLHSSAARTQANKLGYDEALVMNAEWKIVEGSAENLIMIYRGEAIIPPLASDALEGITLRTAIELLKENNIPIRYEFLDRSSVYTCDELLLTGTAANILYAESVDDRVISKEMGPICKTLREGFDQILSNQHPRSSELLTQIQL